MHLLVSLALLKKLVEILWHSRGFFQFTLLAVFAAVLCGSGVSFDAFEGAHQLGKLQVLLRLLVP